MPCAYPGKYNKKEAASFCLLKFKVIHLHKRWRKVKALVFQCCRLGPQRSKDHHPRMCTLMTVPTITSAIRTFPKKVSKRIMVYSYQPKRYSDTQPERRYPHEKIISILLDLALAFGVSYRRFRCRKRTNLSNCALQ